MVVIEQKWQIIELIKQKKIGRLIGLIDVSGKENYWLCSNVVFPMPKDGSINLIYALEITPLFKLAYGNQFESVLKEYIMKAEPFRNDIPLNNFSIIQYI